MAQTEKGDYIDSLWDWYLAAISGGAAPSLIDEITQKFFNIVDPIIRREVYTILLGEAR